jgi:hypothetical protein
MKKSFAERVYKLSNREQAALMLVLLRLQEFGKCTHFDFLRRVDGRKAYATPIENYQNDYALEVDRKTLQKYLENFVKEGFVQKTRNTAGRKPWVYSSDLDVKAELLQHFKSELKDSCICQSQFDLYFNLVRNEIGRWASSPTPIKNIRPKKNDPDGYYWLISPIYGADQDDYGSQKIREHTLINDLLSTIMSNAFEHYKYDPKDLEESIRYALLVNDETFRYGKPFDSNWIFESNSSMGPGDPAFADLRGLSLAEKLKRIKAFVKDSERYGRILGELSKKIDFYEKRVDEDIGTAVSWLKTLSARKDALREVSEGVGQGGAG